MINKLNNADKELYKDRGKGKNPARKCQKEYQPLVLKKEEIEKRKEKNHLAKSFIRKLLLQEPITKFNPYFVAKIVDLFVILHFLSFIVNIFN